VVRIHGLKSVRRRMGYLGGGVVVLLQRAELTSDLVTVSGRLRVDAASNVVALLAHCSLEVLRSCNPDFRHILDHLICRYDGTHSILELVKLCVAGVV